MATSGGQCGGVRYPGGAPTLSQCGGGAAAQAWQGQREPSWRWPAAGPAEHGNFARALGEWGGGREGERGGEVWRVGAHRHWAAAGEGAVQFPLAGTITSCAAQFLLCRGKASETSQMKKMEKLLAVSSFYNFVRLLFSFVMCHPFLV